MQIANLGVIGQRRNFTGLHGMAAIKTKPKPVIKDTHPLLSFHLISDYTWSASSSYQYRTEEAELFDPLKKNNANI